MKIFFAILVVLTAAVRAADGDAAQSPSYLLETFKPLFPNTDIIADGEAACVILVPDGEAYRKAGHELAQQIAAAHGATPAVMDLAAFSDFQDAPGNILTIGNPGDNALIRQLELRGFIHFRSLGRQNLTRRIQTVHDPWGVGKNVVILGGVSVESARENFPVLLGLLRQGADGSVFIGRTIEPLPPMPEGIRTVLERRKAEWDEVPDVYIAYNADWAGRQYLEYGHEEFAELYRDSMLRAIERDFISHLFIYRKFRNFDVLEESPAFTDEQRLAILNFLIETIVASPEGMEYMEKFGDVPLLGNHPTQSVAGILTVTDYLRRHFPHERHKQWYERAAAMFEKYQTGSYVRDECNMQFASIDNIVNAVLSAVDSPATHPFLKNTLRRLIPEITNFGHLAWYGGARTPVRQAEELFLLGARIYNDPEFQWIYEFLTGAHGGDPWWPATVEPDPPRNFIGLDYARPDSLMFSVADPQWVEANQILQQDCFGKAAFRGGISPNDDYLLLDGVGFPGHVYEDANGVLQYSALDCNFLVSMDAGYGSALSAHNVVSTSLDGIAAEPGKLAIRRTWADLPDTAMTRTVLRNAETSDWERNILWMKNRFFVVFDRVLARRDGLHSAVAFWRAVGEPEPLPEGIRIRQPTDAGEAVFTLLSLAADSVGHGRDEDPQATYNFHRYAKMVHPMDKVPHAIHMVKAHKARRLETGGAFTIPTVFWAACETKRPQEIHSHAVSENTLLLETNDAPMLVTIESLETDSLAVDAAMLLLGDNFLAAADCTRLRVGDTLLFASDTPASFQWNPETGELVFADDADGNATDLFELLPASAWRRAFETALLSLTQTNRPAATKHLQPAPGQLRVLSNITGPGAITAAWTGPLAASADPALAVGRQDGSVELYEITRDPLLFFFERPPRLAKRWSFQGGGRVNSLDAGDLDGNAALEILAGSDDHFLYAFDRHGDLLWKWTPPFDERKATQAYNEWMWPEPFVKKIVARDLTGDGRSEVVAGAGMDTFGVSGSGELLWDIRLPDGGKTQHNPAMTTILFADLTGDGAEEIIGGASDMWYQASLDLLDRNGARIPHPAADDPELPRSLSFFRGDGWASGVKTGFLEKLSGNGTLSLVYGTRKGGVFCYPDVSDPRNFWYQRFGDMVTLLATVGDDNGRNILAAGGATQWLTALDAEGTVAWAQYFDSPLTALAADPDGKTVLVGCANGTMRLLDADGNSLAGASLDGAPSVVLAAEKNLWIAGTKEGTLYLLEANPDTARAE